MTVVRHNLDVAPMIVKQPGQSTLSSRFFKDDQRLWKVAKGGELLKSGSAGMAVCKVQSGLATLGRLHAPLGANKGLAGDGAYGSRTSEAVRRFQRYARIGVDGKVGPYTVYQLDLYLRQFVDTKMTA